MDSYHEGKANLLIRGYFYLSTGLSLAGEFRNIGLAIFGLYITLKLENPWLMLLMFLISVLILIPMGWIMVHKVSRVKEWLSVRYGSHYSIRSFDYAKGSYEALEEISRKLDGKKGGKV